MRPALLLFLCVACGTTAIPGPGDGGTGGGSSGGGGGGAAGGTGGGTGGGSTGGSGGGTAGGAGGGGGANGCSGLEQAQCRATPGCVADTCFVCTCSPTYLGCRPVNAPMLQCPLLDCLTPLCCHTRMECSAAQQCAPPGAPIGCGTCFTGPGECTDDMGCATGKVCTPIPCSCDQAMRCTDGCTSDGECGDGQECSGGAHPRCVTRHCVQPGDCGFGFDCLSATCVRRSCAVDANCGPAGTAFCVEGQCYSGLGECRVPVQ